MNIYFWHSCLSPHQLPFIKELPEVEGVDEVHLAIPQTKTDGRENLGWEQNSLLSALGKVHLHINPEFEEVKTMFSSQTPADLNVFDGLRAFPFVFEKFRISLSYNVKRAFSTEPPYAYKYPLWVHRLRFLIQDYRYLKHISYIYCMGDDAVAYYKSFCSKAKVIPFLYCVDADKIRFDAATPISNIRFVFVGNLTERKNVKMMLKAFAHIKDATLTIFGDGMQKEELMVLSEELGVTTQVEFKGSQPMSLIYNQLTQYDVLILPSKHDGWGAVVNEALAAGVYVLCSDKCGARTLLHNPINGTVFTCDEETLTSAMETTCKNIKEIRKNKIVVHSNSKSISGQSIARYFVESLTKSIIVPWKR